MRGLIKLFSTGNTEFFELFDKAGANLFRGAELLDKMINDPARVALAKDIAACEHEGDQITREINERLNRTFVTPFDREDIAELATGLDDILDFIEETADYLGLYRIREIRPSAPKQTAVLVKSVKEIAAALPKLQRPRGIAAHIDAVYRLEHEGDRVVREAITELFRADVDPKTLMAWKDLFERLEDAVDATERTANILKGIVIKNA